MRLHLTCFVLMVLVLLSIDCLPAYRYAESKPSSLSKVPRLPHGRVTSLLQQLTSSSSGGALPMVGRSQQAETQRRAMTLGSRLEPVAVGTLLSPGVKAMRYGK